MKNKNFIFEELKEISPLTAQITKTNVYTVPATYFNTLFIEIIKKINLLQISFIGSLPVTPYRTPPAYFETLSESILKKINQQVVSNAVFEETAAIAPLLNTISKKPVYSIPANFFEQIQAVNLPDIKPAAKVIAIRRPVMFKYSAAAVIILLALVSLFITTGRNDTFSTATINTRKEVKNLSREEIVQFLKSNVPVENVTSVSPVLKTENAIKSSLKEISDKEIQQFLKETGESDEI